jgi:hypothetical protein
MAIDEDDPQHMLLAWTANGNWNDPFIAAAMGALGVMWWDPGQSKSPRGKNGAPGDAEQRMLSEENWIVKAMAVSRPLCVDCADAVADYGIDNGPVQVAIVPPPLEREIEARAKALAALAEVAARVRAQLELYAGEHKTEAAMIETPSVTGFVGYWTNRLFNTDVPPQTIWIKAYGALAAADSAIRSGDARRALANLIRARRQFLLALRRYSTWKDGIEPAGQKAQLAIGAIALAAIAAIVAPAVVAAAAEGAGEAGSLAATEQMTVRVAQVIAEGDAEMLAAMEADAELEIAQEAAFETDLLLF